MDSNYNPTFVYETLISRLYEMRWNNRIVNRCNKRIEGIEYPNYIKGNILEEFVWCNIVNILKSQGYKWRDRKPILPKTYYMVKNRQTKRVKKNGGIDIFLSILDEHLNRYKVNIQCSNWMNRDYVGGIDYKLYKKRIRYAFDRYANTNDCIRIEIIPYYNLKFIEKYCDVDNIIVIPINKQLLESDMWFNQEKSKYGNIL